MIDIIITCIGSCSVCAVRKPGYMYIAGSKMAENLRTQVEILAL